MDPAQLHTQSFTENTIQNRRQMFRRLRAKTIAKQTPIEKFASKVSRWVGTIEFLFLNIYVFLLWILLQSGAIPGIHPFDRYPYILLITSISIESILLTIFILISQHQQEKLESLREQITLQFDIMTEEEITKLMHLVSAIAEKNNIKTTQDKLLQEMLKPVDLEKIEKALEKQLEV